MFFSSSRNGSVCDRWMQRGARSSFTPSTVREKRFCLRSVDAAWSKVEFCAEYGAGSVFALRGCAVTRCTAESHACATAV